MADKQLRKWVREELMPWIEGQSGGPQTQDDGPGGQNPPPPPPPPPVGGGDPEPGG